MFSTVIIVTMAVGGKLSVLCPFWAVCPLYTAKCISTPGFHKDVAALHLSCDVATRVQCVHSKRCLWCLNIHKTSQIRIEHNRRARNEVPS